MWSRPSIYRSRCRNDALTGEDYVSSGWLAGAIHIALDWEEWQRRASGDARLFLLRGALEIVMREAYGGEERRVAMKAGGALIVPRGAWYRVMAAEAANLLRLVRGPGSERAAL